MQLFYGPLYFYTRKLSSVEHTSLFSTGSHPTTGHRYTMEDLRRMEADLKRKSDLLSEVKILLGQAAERERSLIAEREEAKAKVN